MARAGPRTVVLSLLLCCSVASACAYDVDCSLNGVCNAGGTCACYQGWSGVNCGVLALLPAPVVGAYGGGVGSDVSSWGAGVAHDPVSDVYVMFVDE